MLKSKQRTLLSCAISSVLGLGVGATALAQETSRTSVLEEVIVTAEKRAVDIQDVPVAVSAYTSETRTLLGVNTVEDLARFTPSVAYRNDDRLAIRGVGRLTNAVGTDPAVALYSDGIFSTSMADTSTPPLFIERTEILRGPQGTLYGRNCRRRRDQRDLQAPHRQVRGRSAPPGRQLQLLSRRRPGPRPDHRQPALPVRRVFGEARRRLHQECRSGQGRRHQRSLDGRGADRNGSRRERRGPPALLEVRMGRHLRRGQHAAVEHLALRHDHALHRRPVLQPDVRLHGHESGDRRQLPGGHESHRGRHARAITSASISISPGISGAARPEVLRRLPGIPVSHGRR